MDILTSFRIFGRVAETGSFSAVARERGMSQPAISRQVAALEEYYGVRLIHRTTRKSALTEEGKALLPHVHAIITSLDAAQDSVQPAQKSISGVVRITVPVALGIFLASRVHSLLDAHPHLSFDIPVSRRGADPRPDRAAGFGQAHLGGSPGALSGWSPEGDRRDHQT